MVRDPRLAGADRSLPATPPAAPGGPPAPGFRRELGLLDTAVVVAGGIIGVGIFVNPANVARLLPAPGLVLLVWVLGGLVALLGAFVYAELGSRLPLVGGQYVYLARAYHPAVGFLYGFAQLFVINSGAMAAVAIVLADYVDSAFWPLGAGGQVLLAIAVIAALTAVNYLGVRPGKWTNNLFMLAKVGGIGTLVALALWKQPAAANQLLPLPPMSFDWTTFSLLFAAAVPVLFAYGGWENSGNVAGEIKNPARNLALANILGVSAVVAIYVGLNVVYLRVLPHAQMGATKTLAADVAAVLMGEAGRDFVAGLVVFSCLGFLSVIIFTGPRLYYAMAIEGLFFRSAGRLHPRYRTPGNTILLQSGMAVLLLLTNSYDDLLEFVISTAWIFFALTAGAIFRLRRKGIGEATAFRVPGHPVTTILFFVAAAAVVLNTFAVAPRQSLTGLGILAAGLVVYGLFLRGKARFEAPPNGTDDSL